MYVSIIWGGVRGWQDRSQISICSMIEIRIKSSCNGLNILCAVYRVSLLQYLVLTCLGIVLVTHQLCLSSASADLTKPGRTIDTNMADNLRSLSYTAYVHASNSCTNRNLIKFNLNFITYITTTFIMIYKI